MARLQQAAVHIADLGVSGRSYQSTWTERGVIAHAYLEPLQDNDPSKGYQLDFLTSREAGPGPLGSRQERIGSELIGQLRQQMLAKMQAAGWRVVGSHQGKEVWKLFPASDPPAPQPAQAVPSKPKLTRRGSDLAGSASRESAPTPEEQRQTKTYVVYGSKEARERGATPAYTRRVSTRTVTFCCAICGTPTTQQCYPGQRPHYCSNEACKREGGRRRVERSREKKKQAQQQSDQ